MLPWWLSSKESTCNAGDSGDMGSIPGLGRSPEGGRGNPLQYSCLGNPTEKGAWLATYSPYGRKELDTTEATLHASTHEFINVSVCFMLVYMYLIICVCN